MDNQNPVVHEHKLHPSLTKLLWAAVIVIGLNAVPSKLYVPEANAQQIKSEMQSAISYCWDQATLEKRSNGDFKVKTYC